MATESVLRFSEHLQQLSEKYGALGCSILYRSTPGLLLEDDLSVIKSLPKQVLKCQFTRIVVKFTNDVERSYFTIDLPPLEGLEHDILGAQLDSLFGC